MIFYPEASKIATIKIFSILYFSLQLSWQKIKQHLWKLSFSNAVLSSVKRPSHIPRRNKEDSTEMRFPIQSVLRYGETVTTLLSSSHQADQLHQHQSHLLVPDTSSHTLQYKISYS